MPKPRAPKNRPIPIRIDSTTLARLEGVAARMGCNRSEIIRLAILSRLPLLEGGQIKVPSK